MKYLFLLLILSCFLNCKSFRQKTIKKRLSLSQKQYKNIKDDQEIIEALFFLVKDSIENEKIRKPLDKFFKDKKRKELIAVLELYSVFGNKLIWEAADIDSTDQNVIKINSLDELKKFKGERKRQKELSKKTFNEKYKKKDSI